MSNQFLTLAQQRWKSGEDGELIAHELAQAFRAIVDEARGPKHDLWEYQRLREAELEPRKTNFVATLQPSDRIVP